MRHALVIGDDSPAAAQLNARLRAAGYTRVTCVHDAGEAWAAAARKPDIVVVLAAWEAPTDVGTLYRISRKADAPVLVATSDPVHATRCLGAGAALDGPVELEAVRPVMEEATAA
jgi:AmiR/NasT family two-component response regulator